jgi:hypothetical protein
LEEGRNRLSPVILFAVLFAVYCFVFSESGLMERSRLDGEKDRIELSITRLKDENEKLRGVYRRYVSGNLGRDEAVKIGYFAGGEKLLVFKPELVKKDLVRRKSEDVDSSAGVDQLRILWIIISSLVMLFYMVHIRREQT